MDWLKSAARRTAKFARLGAPEKWLVIRTIGLLVRIRAALWLLPFQRVRLMADRMGRPRIPQKAKRLSPANLTSLVSVGAAYVPGANCLTQALVAQVLLKQHGYSPLLKIGVGRSPDKRFQAHAWIELDGKTIIGQLAVLDRYTPLPTLAPVRNDE
jgi:hypothetical protein